MNNISTTNNINNGTLTNSNNINNGTLTNSNNPNNDLNTFNMCMETFRDLGNPQSMLSNFEEMEKDLKNLTDFGYIDTNSGKHRMMTNLISNAENILLECQVSPSLPLESIIKFYTTCTNHKDMTNLIKSSDNNNNNNGSDNNV